MIDPSREEASDEERLGGDEALRERSGEHVAAASGVAGNAEAASDENAGDEEVGAAENEDEVDVASGDGGRPGPMSTAPSVGMRLREAREGCGLGLEDLARTLNLQPRIVAALEADDEGALPGAPFVRGYLRSYARLVGMDPAPLLKEHECRTGGVVVEVRPSPWIEEAKAGPGLMQERPGTVMAVVTVGFIAVVIGVLLLLRSETLSRPESSTMGVGLDRAPAVSEPAQPPTQTPPVPAAHGPSVEPVVERMNAEQAASDSERSVADVSGAPPARALLADGPTPEPIEAPVALGAAGEDAVLRTRTADGLGIRVLAGGEDHLHFTFVEDCWVEVRDGDEVRVYEGLVRDGEVLDLWGRAPFRILLGYAPAVELIHNGSRVALRPFTRNDVASLTLGR